MRRNNAKNFVYNAGKTLTSQALMYQHMSNHYRKILNAKKAVDASPPLHFKPKRNNTSSPSPPPARSISPNKKIVSRNTSPALTERSNSTNSYGGSCWEVESYLSKKISHRSRYQDSKRGRSPSNPSNVDMELIDRIVFDTKHGPTAYFDVGWEQENSIDKPIKNFKTLYGVDKNRTSVSPVANSKRKSNRSRIFPQKRMFLPKMENEDSSRSPPIDCNIKTSSCKCSDMCVCERNENSDCKCKSLENGKEQSQTSSRDSAYNGGVSSLPESRSPTPDQKKGDACRCKSKERELYDGSTEDTEVILPAKQRMFNKENPVTRTDSTEDEKDERKVKVKAKRSGRANSPKYMKGFRNQRDDSDTSMEDMKKIKEDALYTKLIEDITSEVLRKGLYTNKALKKVMKRHVMANLGVLDKGRMLKEIDQLRIQLGIPEDDSLLNLQTQAVESSSDLRECYPVISDSAFTWTCPVKPQEADENFYSSYSWTSHHFYSRRKKSEESSNPDLEEKRPIYKSFSQIVEGTKASTSKQTPEEEFVVNLIDEDESVSVVNIKKMLDKNKRNAPSMSASYPADTSSDDESEKITIRRRSGVRDREKISSPVRRKSIPRTEKIQDSSDDESEEEKTVKEILPKKEITKEPESPKKKNVNFSQEEKNDKEKKEIVASAIVENENQGNKFIDALYLNATKSQANEIPLLEDSEFVVRVDGQDSNSHISSEESKLTMNGSGKN